MTATRVSPWIDMLRHRYEAGSTVGDLAYWYSTSRYQMAVWLTMAGANLKKGKRGKVTARSADADPVARIIERDENDC